MSLLTVVGTMLFSVATMAPAIAAPVAPNATTPLELGLAERACGIAAYSSVTESDTDKPCVSTNIAALRADFGRDLAGLSARERRGLDGACSRLNTPLSRDRYLDCLNTELEMMRTRRKQSSAAGELNTGASSGSAVQGASATRQQVAVFRLFVWMGGLVVVVAAGGAAFFVVRRRNAHAAAIPTSAASA